MPRIAISYRREDSGVITGRIFDRLVTHYGRDSVFRDIDNIPLGVDFRDHINETLDASTVVLAIVGPQWTGPRETESRINDEADPVRVEIEAVLRKGLRLIPVLVLGAAMPSAADLPEPLKPFAYRNATRIDASQDFDVHIERLIRALDVIIQQTPSHAGVQHPEAARAGGVSGAVSVGMSVGPAPTKRWLRSTAFRVAAALAAVVVIAVALFAGLNRQHIADGPASPKTRTAATAPRQGARAPTERPRETAAGQENPGDRASANPPTAAGPPAAVERQSLEDAARQAEERRKEDAARQAESDKRKEAAAARLAEQQQQQAEAARAAEIARVAELDRQKRADADRQLEQQQEAERQKQEAERQRQRTELADREQRGYSAAKGNLAALRAYVNTCTICAYESDARSEITKLDGAEQEERTYSAAHGNAYALRAYVAGCKICTFENAARGELENIETTAQEEQSFNTARGNLYSLRTYLSTCKVCAHANAARDEIAKLSVPETKPQRAASTTLCGRSVDYAIDLNNADLIRSLLGVWTGAAWNSRVCGALVVEGRENDGTIRIKYVYGPLPGSRFPWRLMRGTGTFRNGQLSFQDDEGGSFIFQLSGQNALHGHFTSARGVKLESALTREMSSVP